MHVELLLFEGFDELDALGPYEVLAGTGAATGRLQARLVTLEAVEIITAAHGTQIRPHGVLSERPDLVLVPGGGWIAKAKAGVRSEAARGALPKAIAARHAAGSIVASVCTGAMLLAAAGLLRGRPAVTHHSAIEDLRETGATVIADARVVDDGDIITAGGITCGLDLAVALVERELGADTAAAVARNLEYEPSTAVRQASREGETKED